MIFLYQDRFIGLLVVFTHKYMLVPIALIYVVYINILLQAFIVLLHLMIMKQHGCLILILALMKIIALFSFIYKQILLEIMRLLILYINLKFR